MNVALVTGGARGIGKAIAEALRRDHRVFVTWRTTRPDSFPDDVASIQADLRDPEERKAVVEAVMARFGRLNVIVNNAGVVVPSAADAAVDQAGQDALRDMVDVNVLAPAGLLADALPVLKEGASIVNISSVNATLPPKGASIFGATKAALELWTRGMAKELGGRGIRVNAVAPGAIDLPEAPRSPEVKALFVGDTALGRIGVPEDVARAVRFLVSDDAAFITGEVLTVSGGYRL